MYHESLGIPRTKPALNLIYSLFPYFPIMHRAKNWSSGGTCHFQRRNDGLYYVQFFCLLIQPIFPRLIPVFSPSSSSFFFFSSSLSSLLQQHIRPGFACITILLQGKHPGGYCEQIPERKEKKKLEKDLIFCIFEKKNEKKRNAPRGHEMRKRQGAGGYDRFP